MPTILETAVVPLQGDFGNIKNGAISFAMLCPSVPAEFFQKLLCVGNRTPLDNILGFRTGPVFTFVPPTMRAVFAGVSIELAYSINSGSTVSITSIRVNAFRKLILNESHSNPYIYIVNYFPPEGLPGSFQTGFFSENRVMK